MPLPPTCRLLPILLLLCAAGCATPPRPDAEPDSDPAADPRSGQVGYSGIALDQGEHLDVAFERFTPADPPVRAERILPVYPGVRLQDPLPATAICAELWIDAAGSVYAVHPLIQPPDCPALDEALRSPFDEAVAQATRQWPFLPAFVCEEAADGPADLECKGHGRRRDVAIRQGYRFVFEQSGGEGRVSDAPLPSRPGDPRPRR